MATNLPPEVLALLAQWQQGQAPVQAGGYTYQPNWGTTEGPNGAPMPDYFGGVKSWDRTSGDFRKGGAAEQFNPDGTFSHDWQATGETPFLRDLAIWAAMAGGVGAAGGALTGGGLSSAFGGALGDAALGGAGAETAGAGGGALEAAAGAGGGSSLTPAAIEAAMGTPGYGYSAAGASLGTGALNGAGAGAGGSFLSGLGNMLGGNTLSTLGQLGMGVAGALDSRDKTNTTTQNSTREPWGPSQPLLQSLLNQGQQLQQQYAQNPFSDQQKTAYNNFGGLLNAINGGAQGLFGGASANASGANNYDRSNPRKALTGSSFNLSQFAPGLLNFFGGGK